MGVCTSKQLTLISTLLDDFSDVMDEGKLFLLLKNYSSYSSTEKKKIRELVTNYFETHKSK